MGQIEKIWDCAVLGGGAAGMMAAITAARNHAQTVVIEHTGRVGSKLLQTGNGKCNFTNRNMSMDMYQNGDTAFVSAVISQFGVDATLDFFKGIGIYSKERNGYIYPHSETAASLQDALRMEMERLGVCVMTECEVGRIRHMPEAVGSNSLFLLDAQGFDKPLRARSLVLAAGSMAAKKTGSDGSGYRLAKALGHTIKKPLPALVQLVSSNPLCKGMAGVRSTGLVTLLIDGRVIDKEQGEIQYTDYGLSGIPVFQISHAAVSAADLHKDVRVAVDMLPDLNVQELMPELLLRAGTESAKTLEQFFSGLLNKKLVRAAAKQCGLDADSTVDAKKIRRLLAQIKDFQFVITGFKSFEQAQVCQGGVRLHELDALTLQSKRTGGLYFAGEILDVDGRCGGYNLQWAWSSGYVAGLNASRHAKQAAGFTGTVKGA